MPWSHGWGGGFWIFPFIGLTFMLAIVFALLRGVFGRPFGTGCGDGSRAPESPLEIARRRYAAGEIDRDEFEEIKKNLA